MGNPYNGFSSTQREEAYAWMKAEEAAGRLSSVVSRCCACGQTRGRLEKHSEDYSRPFGPHIGAFGLCVRCHMLIHLRFRRPEAWAKYIEAVAAGYIFEPLTTRTPGSALHLDFRKATRRVVPAELVLDTIASGGATSPTSPRRFDVPVVMNDPSRRGLFA